MTVATQDAMTAENPAKYDVFLGGSCNPTKWRQEKAIPFLEPREIRFYNPQMPFWRPEFIQLEHDAKMNASLLFFVVDNETRAVASMIETTYLAACGRCLVLVVNLFHKEGHLIAGESISRKELHDLSYAQHVMMDLVEREGIPVFDNMDRALDCAAYIIRKQRFESSSSGAGFIDKAGSNFGVPNPIRMSHVTLGDKLKKVKEAFDALDIYNVGKLSIEDIGMAFRILTKRNLTPEEIRNIQARSKKRRLSASFSSHYSNVPSFVRDRRSGSSGCIIRRSIVPHDMTKNDAIPSPLSTTTTNDASADCSSASANCSIAKSHSTSDATVWTQRPSRGSGRPILPHVRAETVDLCRNSRGGLMTSTSNCIRKELAIPVGKSSSSINLAFKKKARRRTVSGLTKEVNDGDGVADEGLPDYGRIVETTRNSIDEGASVDFDEFCRIVAALKVREDRRKRSPPVSLITLEETSDGSSLTLSDVSGSSDKINGQHSPFEPAMWREENYWNWWKCGGRQDVYLGGVPGDTNWRENVAVPMLKKNALTYYCPSSSAWSDRLSSTDMAAMDTSRVLLFVITDRTRSLGSMIMAAYYIGLGRDVILCIQLLPRSIAVQGELLSEAAVKDYNRGRVYLNDLARREGVPVFEGVKEAVECAVQKCLQG